MKTVSGKDFARAVERKGWSLARITGSHHVYAKAGHAVRLTIPIHGSRPLKVGLQHHLMKLAGIDDADL